jgi:Flp pilus assembly protein TadG
VKKAGSQRGTGLIELALLFTTLMLLLLGVVDFALAIQAQMVVSEAACAGAHYGEFQGTSPNTTMMQTVATNAAGGIPGFSALATKWCACSSGGSAVSCGATCPSSTYGPIVYVQVVTSATASLLFKYTGIPLTVPLSGVCILRVQ